MSNPSPVHQLAQYLAGEFDNYEQAIADPVWYVQLRVWHRLLPQRLHGEIALFAEQANLLKLDLPYRQRVFTLSWREDLGIQVQYYACKQPESFWGAGVNPDLLKGLTEADLDPLPGCQLQVRQEGERYIAQPHPEAKCCFLYQGQTRQVVLGFEVTADQFWSHDRGVDPETGQGLWGALMGPYRHQKRQSYAEAIPV